MSRITLPQSLRVHARAYPLVGNLLRAIHRGDDRISTHRWSITVALVVVGLVMTAAVAVADRLALGYWDPDERCCDHLYYRSMAFNTFSETRPDLNVPPAGNPLAEEYSNETPHPYLRASNKLNRQPPFAYRVLAPLAARTILYVPGVSSINAAFFILTFASLVSTSVILGLSVYHLTARALPAVTAAVSFSSLWWAAGVNLRSYMLVDAPAYMFLSLAIYFLVTGHRTGFFGSLLIGVFIKEIVLIALISYWLHRKLHRRLDRSDVGLSVVVISIYGGFRLLLPIPENDFTFSVAWVGIPYASSTVLWMFGTFYGLALASFVRIRYSTRLGIALLPIAIGSFIAALFALNHERALVFAFPFVVLLAFSIGPRTSTARTAVVMPYALLILFQAIFLFSGYDQLAVAVIGSLVALVIEFWLIQAIQSERKAERLPPGNLVLNA